jgi:hypothetical protein
MSVTATRRNPPDALTPVDVKMNELAWKVRGFGTKP